MITLDIESVGLHGMPVLIQWAEDDGPINLYEPWRNPIRETLELISLFAASDIQGFNLGFDWFHICKLYTTLSLFPDLDVEPQFYVDEIALLEEQARFADVCVKPKRARDIMLLARRGPYQSLMGRDDIRIRRVPRTLAPLLVDELEKRVHFDDIYFARSKDKTRLGRWRIYDIKEKDGKTINPDFKDVKLKFKASGSLKALAQHALKIKDVTLFRDIELPSKYWPDEYGYAPYALAVTPEGAKNFWTHTLPSGDSVKSWPAVIKEHIFHWSYHKQAREYAANDVDYTRRLGQLISPEIEPGDDDSELAIAVACCRWRGYAVDRDRLLVEKARASNSIKNVPIVAHVVRPYLHEVVTDPIEKTALEIALQKGTGRKILEYLANKWTIDCPACEGSTKNEDGNQCGRCGGTGEVKHPVAERAALVLGTRRAKKKIELIDKLLLANRLHADFKVVGTLSSRMAGAGGVNATGIDHSIEMRSCFPLAEAIDYDGDGLTDFLLDGGDFKSFEVSIAARVFNDDKLTAFLKTGGKIHAWFATHLFPGKTIEEIKASEGHDPDMYDSGKKGIFAIFYGADENTLKIKLNIDVSVGRNAIEMLCREFTGIGRFAAEMVKDFGALRQPGGIGSRVEWREPKEYVDSILGDKRYFTLEWKVARALFDLAQELPPAFRAIKVKVRRRADKIQTAGGAVQSALYGSAFGITSSVLRQAKNHHIQAAGARITKSVQRRIWNFQPCGIGPWIVQPMNVHDEIMNPTRRGYQEAVRQEVNKVVDSFKKDVPLLAIDWFSGIPNWANKKG